MEKNKKWRYIDAHAHINIADFDADRDAVLLRASEAGVYIIDVGVDLSTSEKAIALAKKNDGIKAVVGVHPTEIPLNEKDRLVLGEKLRAIAKESEVIAIGECGLDYFHNDDEINKLAQRELFEMQIDIAHDLNKPLMLHIRNGKGRNQNANEEALEILSIRKPKAGGNAHFFSGTLEEAKRYIELGFTLSFTGVITFARNYDEIIKNIPLDKILSETDCPFVAPLPYRGKRNEPAYVVAVVKWLADIKEMPEETVRGAIMKNASRLFKI
ncbi:MAG: TatD family hydrolase [bacterium]